MVSRAFTHSVSANLTYWRRRARSTETEDLAALYKERHNLYRAVEAGLALDSTWRPAAELCLALRTLFEHYGHRQEWIDLLARMLDRCPDSDRVLKVRLLYEQGFFLRLERRLDEARQRMEQALKLVTSDHPLMEAAIRHGLSTTFYHLRQYDLAEEHGRQALTLFQENSDTPSDRIAITLNVLGIIAQGRGQWEQSIDYLERAIARYRQLEMPVDLGRSLKNLGLTLEAAGQVKQALAAYEEAEALLAPTNHELEKTLLGLSLGTLYFNTGRYEEAQRTFEQANSTYLRRQGPAYYQALALNNLANVHLKLKRLKRSRNSFRQAITLWRQVEDQVWLANSLHGLAEALMADGRQAEALPLWREAMSILESHLDDAYARELRAEIEASLASLTEKEEAEASRATAS